MFFPSSSCPHSADEKSTSRIHGVLLQVLSHFLFGVLQFSKGDCYVDLISFILLGTHYASVSEASFIT
jgi:hypothetical protein